MTPADNASTGLCGWIRVGEIAAAAVLWVSARAVLAVADPPTVTLTVAAGTLFAAAFVAFLAAVERRRGQADPTDAAAWNGSGSTVFALGLFFYFVVIPAAVEPAADAVRHQLFYMLFTFDLYAAGKLVHFGNVTRKRRWQRLYSLLVLTAVGVFLNDAIAFLRVAGVVPEIGAGVYVLMWTVPLIFLVLAARWRQYPLPSTESLADSADREELPRPRGRLVAFTLVFPFIHLLLHGCGLLGAAAEPVREAFVLIWLVVFGALALGQERQLVGQVRRLERERRRAEGALQRHEESRRRDQEPRDAQATRRIPDEKLIKAWRSIPDAMVVSTVADGRILEVNDSFLRHFGYERDEVLGKTGVELKLWVEPEDRAMMTRLLREHGAVRNLAFELTRRSGEKRLTLLSGEIVDLEGTTCFVMVLRDVTELRSLEFTLK